MTQVCRVQNGRLKFTSSRPGMTSLPERYADQFFSLPTLQTYFSRGMQQFHHKKVFFLPRSMQSSNVSGYLYFSDNLPLKHENYELQTSLCVNHEIMLVQIKVGLEYHKTLL